MQPADRPGNYRKFPPRLLWLLAGAGLCFALTIGVAQAQQISVDLGDSSTITGRVLQLLALLTVLSLAPSLLIMVTSFTRIVVVLSLMRSAMGTQQSPPNSVLISLALFLTAFVMAPTFQKTYTDAIVPFVDNSIDQEQAFDLGVAPIRDFMLAHVRDTDLALFVDLAAGKDNPGNGAISETKTIPLHVLIPAFMISELKRAFEIGFLVFMPFIVIDMVVASVLLSMGMMMLPPVIISLPFKLIFFVLVDGWHLIAGSLVQSYGT